ncbi:unnamed protein product, partial [Chrysoparadoxa australica]
SSAFFNLPDEEKRKIPVKNGGFTRGYIGFGQESGSSSMLECKEAFSYGFDWLESQEPENLLQGPNIWPAKELLDQEWRQNMLDVYSTMVQLSAALTVSLARVAGVSSRSMEKLCQGGDTISLMRTFHYLPYEEEPGVQKLGSSPHTDWGWLTIILQDDAGGLEYQDRETKEWLKCDPREDCLVVNIGDYLSMFSKGRLHSPVHRVVHNPSQERISYVFFAYPAYGAQMLAETEAEGTTGRAEEADTHNTLMDMARGGMDLTQITFGEYIYKKWEGVSR